MFRIRPLNRISVKLMALFLLVILIPASFISFFFYRTATSLVKMNERRSTVQVAKQAADSLSNIFNVGNDTSDYLYGQVRLQEMVRSEENSLSQEERLLNKKIIVNLLNTLIYSNSYVNIVYLFKDNGTGWGSGVFSQAKLDRYKLDQFPWIREAKRMDGRLVWMEMQADKFSGSGDNNALVIPAVRVFKDFSTMANIGYLVINIDGNAVQHKLAELRLGRTGYFVVTNAAGIVMASRDLGEVGYPLGNDALLPVISNPGTEEFEIRQEGEHYYGVREPLVNGWQIIGMVPVKEITSELDRIQRLVLLWTLAFTMLALAVALFFSRRITSPIGKLIGQMKKVEEGDLEARTQIESRDEVGLLSKQFNSMLTKVNRLMSQVREEQSMKQRAEMRAVMHRIDPHFMFNTLSAIKMLIRLGDRDQAYKSITAFNRLLEATMGKKGPLIALEEELDILTKYVDLLRLRYEIGLDLHLSMSPSASRFPIPRMLIQPLVENAIFHGILPGGKDGTIEIIATDSADAVTIVVKDDGVGMDAEEARRLAFLPDDVSADATGIGVRHVLECVNYYFPAGSHVLIRSAPGQGMTVELRLAKATLRQSGL